LEHTRLVLFGGAWALLLGTLLVMCWYISNRDVRQLAVVLFLVVLLGGPTLAAATTQ
jgi:hypothetical protein